MEHSNSAVLIESLVGIILGNCLIFGRMQIAKIFMDYASKMQINYTDLQQKVFLIIIWTIGIGFIFGGFFQIVKLWGNYGDTTLN